MSCNAFYQKDSPDTGTCCAYLLVRNESCQTQSISHPIFETAPHRLAQSYPYRNDYFTSNNSIGLISLPGGLKYQDCHLQSPLRRRFIVRPDRSRTACSKGRYINYNLKLNNLRNNLFAGHCCPWRGLPQLDHLSFDAIEQDRLQYMAHHEPQPEIERDKK